MSLTKPRRQKIREQSTFNGLDYLEAETVSVGVQQWPKLTVYLLNKLGSLRPGLGNVRVTGRRGRVGVHQVTAIHTEAKDADDRLEVLLALPAPWNPGSYTLELLRADKFEEPTDQVLDGIDPRYARLEFSLHPECPADLDCAVVAACDSDAFSMDEPVINYLAKDYASFKRVIFDRLALVMPEWRERHVPDVGVALIEIFAYVGDHLSYHQDAVSTEAYLDTARQRISVRRHARLVDYTMHEGCNARALVQVRVNGDVSLKTKDIKFLAGLQELNLETIVRPGDLRNLRGDQFEVYEVVSSSGQEVTFVEAHNEILFYTWGGTVQCLHRGATRATLKDTFPATQATESTADTADLAEFVPNTPPRSLQLKKGDVLVFEERIGPRTGNAADADPRKRHAVRLTEVRPNMDELLNQPVLELEWCAHDALPFDLCLTSRTDAPDCREVCDVSVALGNIVLVDHGLTVCLTLDKVPTDHVLACCDDCGCGDTQASVPGKFNPTLEGMPKPTDQTNSDGHCIHAWFRREGVPLTFAEPIPDDTCIQAWLKRDPRQALPALRLEDAHSEKQSSPPWLPRQDLLSSGPNDQHVVVEIDNQGIAHLRFGDGELGAHPRAEQALRAHYRLGNGPRGNVPREAITHIMLGNQTVSGGILSVCNPMPAVGGTAAESIEEVKRFAPHAIRQTLKRAITSDDYARLASELFPTEVARAAASLRWTGSLTEVLLAIDARGRSEASPALLKHIRTALEPYRRIGHDLHVKAARNVPLELELRICVQPGYLQGHIRAAVLERLSNRVLPHKELGFFHPDRLSFGEGVFVSRIVAAVRSIQGIESVTIERLTRFGQPDEGAVQSGVLNLGPLEIARLDNDSTTPEHGTLKLNLEGGR
jgi:hypothetical protein